MVLKKLAMRFTGIIAPAIMASTTLHVLFYVQGWYGINISEDMCLQVLTWALWDYILLCYFFTYSIVTVVCFNLPLTFFTIGHTMSKRMQIQEISNQVADPVNEFIFFFLFTLTSTIIVVVLHFDAAHLIKEKAIIQKQQEQLKGLFSNQPDGVFVYQHE